MMSFREARANMVESQVRPNGVTDRRIIDAMGEIARENFVPAVWRSIAYVDGEVGLSAARPPRFLVEAMVFARLAQLAAIGAGDRVLHVGAATGYGTAVLARLAAHVTALESDPALAAEARNNLRALANVQVVEGGLADGLKAGAPYDAILIEGRVGEVPEGLIAQAGDGGRIVAVVGERDLSRAFVWTISGKTSACRAAFDAAAAALPGFSRKQEAFVF